MDRIGEWRLIDADESPEAPARAKEPPAARGSGWERIAALVAIVVIGIAGVAIWVTLPQGGVQLDVAGQIGAGGVVPSSDAAAGLPYDTAAPEIVIDVQGAVVSPGLHALATGSRVGDAIAAAGGYGPQVDIDAAARQLNLAERLVDGSKIHVPRRGDDLAQASAGPPAGTAGGGLVDINHASATELDTLPGIGPVTAAKIIGAREQAPFVTIDELQTRDVVGPATFEKIRELIIAAP